MKTIYLWDKRVLDKLNSFEEMIRWIRERIEVLKEAVKAETYYEFSEYKDVKEILSYLEEEWYEEFVETPDIWDKYIIDPIKIICDGIKFKVYFDVDNRRTRMNYWPDVYHINGVEVSVQSMFDACEQIDDEQAERLIDVRKKHKEWEMSEKNIR